MTRPEFGAILNKLTHLRQQTDFSEPTTGFGRSLKDIDNFIVQRFCNVQNLITIIVKMNIVRETKYNSQIQSNSSATRLEWVKILSCILWFADLHIAGVGLISWFLRKYAADQRKGRITPDFLWDARRTSENEAEHAWACEHRISREQRSRSEERQVIYHLIKEFDPGSGWTLAACLTHASRARSSQRNLRKTEWAESGGRVSNA